MWESNIKMDVRERRWGGVDCIDLALDRNQWGAFINTAVNTQAP
jgi:hypothetical protein